MSSRRGQVTAVRVMTTLFVLILVSGCYLVKQGGYLVSHQVKAKHVSRLRRDSTLSGKQRGFLNEIGRIRQFAVDSIGLVGNDNYTRIVHIDSSYLLAMLSAADSASFIVKKWCYPFFGCFPLRSYFDLRDAERAGARLAQKGYEINIEKSPGYSTLGILSDPVYSFMADYPVYLLANYIFHEQTHATVYLKDVQFSEELATFIGREGALNYLRTYYGPLSPEYRSAHRLMSDQKIYQELIRGLIAELKEVYERQIERAEKIRLKTGIVNTFRERLARDYDSLFTTQRFRGVEQLSYNNAFLAIRITYTLDLTLFDQLFYKYKGNLREIVRFAVSLKKRKEPPKELLKKEIGR
ncbi:MAG: aminopeptidase [Chitinispirillaceae bacterium]|nr:aminopeptidase [Chitinispirillaceae bacterium]